MHFGKTTRNILVICMLVSEIRYWYQYLKKIVFCRKKMDLFISKNIFLSRLILDLLIKKSNFLISENDFLTYKDNFYIYMYIINSDKMRKLVS